MGAEGRVAAMSSALRPVVVGVTEGPESVAAARYAVHAAQLRRTGMVVAHGYVLPSTDAALGVSLAEDFRARADQIVDEVLAGVVVPPHVEVTRVVAVRPPLALLTELSATAGLVVLGQHHLTLVERLTEGRIAGPLVAHAPCPVVVVPPYHRQRPPRTQDRLVVALDGVSAAESVLRFAFEEATLRGARVTALHALGLEVAPRDWDHEAELSTATLGEILAGFRADYPDVTVDTVVAPGDAEDLIVQASRDATLMVVGLPHRSRLGAWTRSVARSVLKRTRCPLAVVPGSVLAPDQQGRLVGGRRVGR